MNSENKKTQLSSYFSKFFAAFAVPVLLLSCNLNSGHSEKRDYCLQRTDSLWSLINETKGMFHYNFEEITERKKTMDSVSLHMKYIPAGRVNAEMQVILNQYAGIQRLYKPLAQEYKNIVLETEDIFYQIKSLEKAVKSGSYDEQVDAFKKEYEKLKSELLTLKVEAAAVTEKLNTIEPLYLRISEQAELFVEANLPQLSR